VPLSAYVGRQQRMHVPTRRRPQRWYFDNSWWQLRTMGSAAPVGGVVAQVEGYVWMRRRRLAAAGEGILIVMSWLFTFIHALHSCK